MGFLAKLGTVTAAAPHRRAASTDLRRGVTIWGSYSWGYADVGADIYVALGLVVGAAMGAANIAFAFAGVVYVCIGLAYTELAAAYPVAGGGQFFVTRALGDFMGFIAGWAVLLDFTIDISLFAWFTIGYLSALVPWLSDHHVAYFLLVLAVTAMLTGLNVKGVRESSRLNEVVAVVDICNETAILMCGFILAWNPAILVHAMSAHWPGTDKLLLGISLAIISFVGLESISQAAEETQRPSTVIPRTSVALILTILIFALSYSNPSWACRYIVSGHGAATPMFAFLGNDANQDKAVAVLAAHFPYVGAFFALSVPLIGALLVLISSNSGVFGASRIAYSMGKNKLLPDWFQRTHRRTRTPAGTILFFSGIAVIELIAAYLQGNGALNFLADLYAFGAALSYTLVFIALITLRFTDPLAPRKFRMPWNVPLRVKGRTGDVSILSLVGVLGIGAIFVFTILTHPIGRIAGPSWVIMGIIFSLFIGARPKRRF
ncbi:MAG: amino acid permease [Candidatus Eremiobacteraeota bacterium]|nr:amino acid permease [Candidatus Eremiobacteraeota bacterium]MBC5828441.1 amino acid permease [Candidatus Eremiobacteraeota bacterium]